MIPPIPAVAPSDEVAFVLQVAGVGALIGAALAARRRTRDREADTWMPPTAWALLFAGCAALVVVAERLGWW